MEKIDDGDAVASGRVRPRRGTEICNLGAPSPLDFCEFSPVDCFAFSPGSLCNLVRKLSQKVEKIARTPGGEKAWNPVTSLAVMFFFGPDCR